MLEERSERDRAFLSNGMTSALELAGTIDWFPCPKFDSKSIFSAILDDSKGGYFSIKPETEYEIESSYIGNSLALRNIFRTKHGALEAIDFLPLGIPGIIRMYRSEVPFTARIKPVFGYGLTSPSVESAESGLLFRNSKTKEGLEVRINGDYDILDEGSIRLGSGEGYIFALYLKDLKYGLSGRHGFIHADPKEALEMFLMHSEEQILQARRPERFKEAYYRSLSAVNGMVYAPSGGAIASPTTSLPEIIGQQRNWDYRYVWIRDASYAAEALATARMLSKARRMLSFLVSLVDPSSKPFGHPLYSIDGTAPDPEETLYWLKGYKGSRPVRIGNEAYFQTQKDIEGAFMSALYAYVKASNELSYARESWWAIESIARWVAESWRSKSASIWEERSPTQHYVHSKVMDWVAVDRASRLAYLVGEKEKSGAWRALSEEIRSDVLQNGFSNEARSFVGFYGSESLDSSLLVLPLCGFIGVNDSMFLATLKALEERLMVKDGLMLRYNADFMGKPEHPFTLLSTWLARIYIRLGNPSRAEAVLNALISSSNNLLLIGEHVDIRSREQRGNFPQLFPHAGLIQAITELGFGTDPL